jgi:outer membrane protein assembly factor BamA
MRTDARSTLRRHAGCPRGPLWAMGVLWWIFTVGSVSAPASAQVHIDSDTEVRSIHFIGVSGLPEKQLRALLQTPSRGSAYGLRAFLGKLPLVQAPAHHPFYPRVLAEDVVRLRNKYDAAGFRGTQVRYEVERVDDENLLDIIVVVEEGVPQQLTEVTIASADSVAPLPVPADQRQSWADVERQARSLAGHRLDAVAAREQRDRLQTWWRDRGFPQASVGGHLEQDSLRNEARIHFVIAAGSRYRFGSAVVRGNESISDRVVHRELAFQPGDFYSAKALSEGRRDLQQLQIIRAARFEVPGVDTPKSLAVADSVLPVVVTITEAKPRLITGQFGYVTDAGLSTEARWNHRNFAGGARVLTVSGLAQTGVLAVSSDPDIRYRGTVSLQQPHVLHRRFSALVSPFVEYRDDTQDRSLQVGSNFTLVYRLHSLLSGSLDYQIAARDIYEYRLEELAAGDVDLLTFLTQIAQGQLDSLGTRLTTSLLTLSGTAGTLDEIANPRRGVLARPALQVTVPSRWSSTAYWRADCSAYAYAPLARRITLAGRLAVGHLFPFGKSVPDPDESPQAAVLRLSDANFTAGGSADVRGWGYRMLGPKFPDVRFEQEGDSAVATADGYVPLGGFSRVSFSLELRLPLPVLGPKFGSLVFFDGGQVWTADSRFQSGGDTYDQERIFYATGAGMDLLTPVGAIRLSVGYKLNPSIVDLVNSDDLLRAEIQGTPIDQIDKHSSHRWQFNFAIGTSY